MMVKCEEISAITLVVRVLIKNKMAKRVNKNQLKKVAEGRIDRLFSTAKTEVVDNKDFYFANNCINPPPIMYLKYSRKYLLI